MAKTHILLFTAFWSLTALAANTEVTCTDTAKTDCTQTNTHSGGHDDLTSKMNSLFPEKQQNAAQRARPEIVKLTTPTFLSTVGAGNVKLEWSAAEGATGYHLQIATDSNFKWLIIDDPLVKTNSFDFSKAEAGQRYFWRVSSTKYENKTTFTKSLFTSSAFDVK